LSNSASIEDVKKSAEQLKKQIASVVEAIEQDPPKEKRILIAYISHVYEAIKQTIKKQGFVMPYYISLANEPDLGSQVNQEVIARARAVGAKGIVSVEGFQSEDDIGDVIYHLSLSAPSMGVLGWVMKVKCAEGKADIVREQPYLFETQDQTKTLGELVEQMETGEPPGKAPAVE
jgi:hypothetical protein